MGANDSPITTRSIVTDYFDWRLNNRTIPNSRLLLIVRRIADEAETAYHSQLPTFNFRVPVTAIDRQTLNNIQMFHREIADKLFDDGIVSWGRIISFIAFSALFAQNIVRQQANNITDNLIISSIIDWTTNFIDTAFREWLERQNYWVSQSVL